jgi:putative ABC transport system permease protein
METLFGIPTDQLMYVLLAVTGAGALILGLSALRNRVAFKMAVRNIPRRKSQSALIVLGLMLATMLFSASFTTGDTLTNSLRTQALENIGQVDVAVSPDTPDSSGPFGGPAARPTFFDENLADEVRDRLKGDEEVAGVAPLISETVAVLSGESDLSEPQVDLLGIDQSSMRGFDRLTTASGATLSPGDLAKDEVYVSAETAERLDVKEGDEVEAVLGTRPAKLTVAGVYEGGANPASETSMVMPLDELQAIGGNEGRINEILITHRGRAVEGGAHTSATVDELKPLLAANDLKAEPVKKDALDQADETGEQFSSIFLLFGQFSIAAGILLIFLIFVMLAAERKRELGIARGVGMQRGHLMRMFAFEGALYALVASALGSVLGVGVGWVMVRAIGQAFAQFDDFGFEVAFATSPQNVVVAFTLGMVLTFLIVLVSSWRVSRLNVIRAIRDIPEPDKQGRTVKGAILALLTPIAGVLAVWQGLEAEQLGLYMLGLSLLIVGAALVARIFRLPDRVAFSLAGLGLLVLWLVPADLLAVAPEGMTQGIEMFFISGIMIVIGGVWVVIYNSDLLLRAVVTIFGRVRGLPPVLKTAVSYPMHNRFRTGMTLAMFSLVVFTIVTMSFINASFGAIYDDTERLSGGFDVRADAGYTAPVADMEEALKATEGVDAEDVVAVGATSSLSTEAKQRGTDREPKDLLVQGIDEGYTRNVGYGFNTTAAEYDTKREVWKALSEKPDTAVISASLAPTRSNFALGEQEPPVELSGFYQEDETLPDDLFITVKDPRSGEERDLRVIGVVDDAAFYAGEVMTPQQTLEALAGAPVSAQSYLFDLTDDANAAAVARNLEEGFARNGLQATVLEKEIQDSSAADDIFNSLLTGFMSLGLLVGIAALGVIAARSVVERRQQIGMLRALGFQKGQVRLAFLLESSFIALLGIGLGVALGAALSGGIVDSLSQDIAGVAYKVPWTSLVVVVVASYAASLLTTFLPARGASKVYPAEALRYE